MTRLKTSSPNYYELVPVHETEEGICTYHTLGHEARAQAKAEGGEVVWELRLVTQEGRDLLIDFFLDEASAMAHYAMATGWPRPALEDEARLLSVGKGQGK